MNIFKLRRDKDSGNIEFIQEAEGIGCPREVIVLSRTEYKTLIDYVKLLNVIPYHEPLTIGGNVTLHAHIHVDISDVYYLTYRDETKSVYGEIEVCNLSLVGISF